MKNEKREFSEIGNSQCDICVPEDQGNVKNARQPSPYQILETSYFITIISKLSSFFKWKTKAWLCPHISCSCFHLSSWLKNLNVFCILPKFNFLFQFKFSFLYFVIQIKHWLVIPVKLIERTTCNPLLGYSQVLLRSFHLLIRFQSTYHFIISISITENEKLKLKYKLQCGMESETLWEKKKGKRRNDL